jgi:hypothetical protein
MRFTKIDQLGDAIVRANEIAKLITVKSYDGDSRGDKPGWSLTDIIAQTGIASCAVDAMCLVNGVTTRGKRVNNRPMSLTMDVKLKVLTRQACHSDKDGVRISTDPTSDDMVFDFEKPKNGDIVRVRTEESLVNKRTGTALSVQEREYAIDNGEPLYDYEDVVVDEDGCITVPAGLAIGMLRMNGKKIRKPSHMKPHSSISNQKEAQKRRITNWLYEEVGKGYECPERRKAAKKAAKASPNNGSESK